MPHAKRRRLGSVFLWLGTALLGLGAYQLYPSLAQGRWCLLLESVLWLVAGGFSLKLVIRPE